MCDLKTLLKNNIQEVVSFIKENINNARIRKDGRVSVNCPYCGDDTKSHLYINIDWANFKCFRCDTTGSIYKIMKDYGLKEEFYKLIQSYNDKIDIKELKEDINYSKNIKKETNSDKRNIYLISKKINEFQKNYKTDLIKNNIKALKYLKSRIDINDINIDLFLCDNNYIYIPIINNDILVMYLGRLYNKENKLKRYIIHKFEDVEIIGFLDEFLKSNSKKLYICEGYFDAYSVNKAFNNNTSICVFGKYSRKIIDALIKYISNDFHIVLLLDSLEKDNNIFSSIDKFYNIISKYFNGISICSLPYSDCNDIYVKEGSDKLKNIIEENTMSYIKYKLLRGNLV